MARRSGLVEGSGLRSTAALGGLVEVRRAAHHHLAEGAPGRGRRDDGRLDLLDRIGQLSADLGLLVNEPIRRGPTRSAQKGDHPGRDAEREDAEYRVDIASSAFRRAWATL